MTEIPHQHKNQQSSKQANRLKVVFLLSSCYLASAVIIVLITGSLSLLSEAGHMLADVGGLALAYLLLTILANHRLLKELMVFLEWRYLHHLQTV